MKTKIRQTNLENVNNIPEEQKFEFQKMIAKENYLKSLKIVEDYENNKNIQDINKRNWFQKIPSHWRYLYYMIGGIIIGILITLF